jgi:WD40 repeat protein/serine/threonine protein kinase
METSQPELRAIFCEALEHQAPQEQADYLDRACQGKPGLRARVEALLRAHAEANSFLQEPSGRPAATVDEGPAAERPGTVVGPYKLLEQIGEGGFGVVFMAEQHQPVRRKVALKVLKPGMDSRQVIARFEAERQALALMDHPHIARVLDAGATAGGRPYFVMELVKGVAITAYCDQNQLPARARLELFASVCQAVQHAHQKGIIHRDLKPSNVLVTLHDGVPVVKVIDFGVAKALGQQLTEKTLFTNFAQLIGTPLYMSPEQAELSGLDIDTRSDIYSLGVLLYELLTGTTPFDRERLKAASFDEIRRIIREEEPPKPSTRISTLGEAAGTVSGNRKSDPKRLRQLFRGELDWIVMKALEKDRNRRYESASAFAADVRRYLDDEPVQACPPSAGYRFQKFARRHRGWLLAASALALVVLLAVVGLAVGMVLIEQERSKADQDRNTAVQERNATADALGREAKAHEATAGALKREADAHALAEGLRKLAEKEKSAAQELEKAALRAKDLAEEQERTIRRNLYAAHMNLAQQAVEASDPVRALLLLNRYRPRADQEDLRSFEWYYWWGQSHRRLLRTLAKHTDAVMAAAFSPDGQTVASAGVDGAVKLWDVASGLERVSLKGHTSHIICVAFSPDGKTLASGGRYDAVRLWDVATSQTRATLEGHAGWVLSVAFSPDGRTLAVASGDTKIRLWDPATGRLKRTLQGRQDPLSVAFSPDGKALASGSRQSMPAGGGSVTLWDLDTGKARDIFTADAAHPAAVAFSPDGKTVAAAMSDPNNDGVVKLWEAATGKLQTTLKGHGQGLMTVAFSPDGKALASAGEDRTVKVWDLATGEAKATLLGHGHEVCAVAFSPDRKTLASASVDRTVKLWDVAAAEPKTSLRGHAKWVHALAFSPDGRTVASSGADGAVKLWDVGAGELKAALAGHTDQATSVAFSPDGATVASASLDRTVKLWDVKTGKLRRALEGNGLSSCSPVAFSPDGKTVATVDQKCAIKLWDADTGALQATLPGHGAPVLSLAFSPDGKALASAGTWDHTARLLDLSSGKERATLTAQEQYVWPFWVVAFSPDGKTLATGGDPASVKLWDAATGKPIRTLTGHAAVVWSLAFCPDGKTLASASYDGTIKLWDLETGEPRTTLHTRVRAIAFSPDGTVLASSTRDGLRLWRAATEKDVQARDR